MMTLTDNTCSPLSHQDGKKEEKEEEEENFWR